MQDSMKKALKSRRMKGLALRIEISPDQEDLEDEKSTDLAPEVEDASPIEDGDPALVDQENDMEGLDPVSIAEAVMGKPDQTLPGKATKSLSEKAKMKMMEILKNKKA